MDRHATDDELFEWARGELPEEARGAQEEHMQGCETCGARLAFARHMMKALEAQGGEEPAPPSLLPAVMSKVREARRGRKRCRRWALSLTASAAACAVFAAVWWFGPLSKTPLGEKEMLPIPNASLFFDTNMTGSDGALGLEADSIQKSQNAASLEEFGKNRYAVQNSTPCAAPPVEAAADESYAVYTLLCPSGDEAEEPLEVLATLQANQLDDVTYELPLDKLESLQEMANVYAIDFSNSILNREGEKVLVKIVITEIKP